MDMFPQAHLWVKRCLAASLVSMFLVLNIDSSNATSLPSGSSAKFRDPGQPFSELYLADGIEMPGKIFQVVNNTLQSVYNRPSGHLSSLAFAEDGTTYFVDANDNHIYRIDGLTITTVYTHETYVRDLDFDPSGNLYFSEASGGGQDGVIYRLALAGGGATVSTVVPLAEVNGFWAGHFTFSPSGELYISSGNVIPASIYKFDGAQFQKLFTHDLPINGFTFSDSNDLYLTTNAQQLYRLTDFEILDLILEADNVTRLTDVALGPTALLVRPNWTFMVYLVGDSGGMSSLEHAAIDDFLEMSTVGSSANVNIVVQFDRIPGYDENYGAWTDTRRFLISQNMEPTAENGVSIGEVNMGDPQTLVDFVEWAISEYPAHHYALIIWNHGNGWKFVNQMEEARVKSVGFDDTSGDSLSSPELSQISATLANDGYFPIDLIGFDACLMAMIEVDNQLIPYANVRVGSEETEPGDGWAYDSVLLALTNDPAMTATDLGKVIVETYYASYGNNMTQSLVDLGTPYTNLNIAVDDFALALMSGVETDYAQIAQARLRTQSFYYPFYIDLYDFAYQITLNVNDPAIGTAATNVMNEIDNVVLLERHGMSWVGAHGISIYFPQKHIEYQGHYVTDLQFAANSNWDEWLAAFYAVEP